MTNEQMERIERIGNSSCRLGEPDFLEYIPLIAAKQMTLNINEARALIRLISNLFKKVLVENELPSRKIEALMRKFRDAGRRSPPRQAASSRGPGRPQDGADGNRNYCDISRGQILSSDSFYDKCT